MGRDTSNGTIRSIKKRKFSVSKTNDDGTQPGEPESHSAMTELSESCHLDVETVSADEK